MFPTFTTAFRIAVFLILLGLSRSPAAQLEISGPPGSSALFGNSFFTLLPNGNLVVPDWGYSIPGAYEVGAVHLYDGDTMELISSLTGSVAGDEVGNGGIWTLASGDFLVRSSRWGGGRGAITWVSGKNGLSGVVSASNSLVGTRNFDRVGNDGVILLKNGNYIVQSQSWNEGRGAVTWGSGTSGVSGEVSAANSLVGSMENASVGTSQELSDGNFLVKSSGWNESRGAVTWCSGTAGRSGVVSAANSLVGTFVGDRVWAIHELGGGSYLAANPKWNSERGCLTLIRDSSEMVGEISQDNSLIGSSPGDKVGLSVKQLANGNCVVFSHEWNAKRGAITFCSAASTLRGEVSSANSLIGSLPNDQLGVHPYDLYKTPQIYLLPDGSYLTASAGWNGNRGAVTWGSGTTGKTGEISISNSLVGVNSGDLVGSQGAYSTSDGLLVVRSNSWNGGRGAVTWLNGPAELVGTVSAANSLVGSSPADQVGSRFGILRNGNVIVGSPAWNGKKGAITFAKRSSLPKGAVSAENSLVGGNANDFVGLGHYLYLSNHNLVVCSPDWNAKRGAVTWISGTNGLTGVVSSSNSLVGSLPNDQVGRVSTPQDIGATFGIHEVANSNYVVTSPYWNDQRGAATWGDGAAGIIGAVSPSNSLVGSRQYDKIGLNVTVIQPTGNYILRSSSWNIARGALTWASGVAATAGEVSSANSLVGTSISDWVGSRELTVLKNGNVICPSPDWAGHRGAVTWLNGTTGITGELSASNSFVGSFPDDYVGNGVIIELTNGNCKFSSPGWNGKRGAVTWLDGATGGQGEISALNSVVGSTPNFDFNSYGLGFPDNLDLIDWRSAGLYRVTPWYGAPGVGGVVTQANSVSDGAWTWTVYDTVSRRLIVRLSHSRKLVVIGYTPEIKLLGGSVTIDHGSTSAAVIDGTDFGGVSPEVSSGHVVRTFTIRNTGMEPLILSGSPLIAVSGAHAGDFIVTQLPASTVGALSSTTFQVTFTPSAPGLRNAVLTIANNDTDEGAFSFAVSGRGVTPFDHWRDSHFGSATTGVQALDDFDNDGVANLLEFGFGTFPGTNSSGPGTLTYTGPLAGGGTITATGQPVTMFETTPSGPEFQALFVRRKDYTAARLNYIPQFSAALGEWEDSTTIPTVLADDGVHQIVSVPYPASVGGQTPRFFRVSVGLTP